jgi:glycerol uptake facilitator-like aquaporin
MYINTQHFAVRFNWRAIACEFIGSMVYVFVGSASITASRTYGGDTVLISALAQGLCLAFLVHIFAPISGAHFNPAITATSIVTKRSGFLEGVLYIIVQLLGSISGGAFSLLGLPHGRYIEFGSMGACYIRNPILKPPVEIGMGRAFTFELCLSFILILVYYGTLFKPKHLLKENVENHRQHLTAAFPIGAAIITCVLTGSATGGCVNPARQFGTELLAWSWNTTSWVFYITPFIGSILGGLIFEFILTE